MCFNLSVFAYTHRFSINLFVHYALSFRVLIELGHAVFVEMYF